MKSGFEGKSSKLEENLKKFEENSFKKYSKIRYIKDLVNGIGVKLGLFEGLDVKVDFMEGEVFKGFGVLLDFDR